MRRLAFRHALVPAVLCASFGACRDGTLAAGVSDSAYVGAMVGLRRVARDTMLLDSAARTAARDSVLQGQGLTAEQLQQASRLLAADPERAAQLWRAIEQKIAADQAP